MNTKTSDYPQSLVEIRIAQHASRMHKIHALKPIVFIIIVVVIAMISKVYAQSGLEDRIVAYQEKSDMRMVSFMQDLPQAEELRVHQHLLQGSGAVSDTHSDIYRVLLANLYKKSSNKSNALAESGLQDINMKDIDASTGGGRYANLDQ